MNIYLVAYALTAIIFLCLDSLWLGLMANVLYRPQLGTLLLEKFEATPAAAFYLVYVAGVVIFAVAPALATGRWTVAMMDGAFFGLCAYATYDLTNQATLRHWPVAVTLADLCWGTVSTATSATLATLSIMAIRAKMGW